ncbi:hypothetical protein Athai_12840 [Actinocatenispora thailandica]|uniref:Uncharacterized protein n=1 Tax=Actinocatenispora thailandica TaxID=227318 RepID=A0A7R7DLN6_9ACTN|nr:hypothetical protein Athai_12840 [Actinocatenispora thailandica]
MARGVRSVRGTSWVSGTPWPVGGTGATGAGVPAPSMLPRPADRAPGSGAVPPRGTRPTRIQGTNAAFTAQSAGPRRHHPTPYRPGGRTAAATAGEAAGSLILRVCRRVMDARALSASRQTPTRTDQD